MCNPSLVLVVSKIVTDKTMSADTMRYPLVLVVSKIVTDKTHIVDRLPAIVFW